MRCILLLLLFLQKILNFIGFFFSYVIYKFYERFLFFFSSYGKVVVFIFIFLPRFNLSEIFSFYWFL
jgi:hypothetical protein